VTAAYSKIANNGSTLADSAKLGANPTDWACTQDKKTRLFRVAFFVFENMSV